MIDVTPYIIVDNERIYPVKGSTRSGSATEKRKESEEQEYGVVDRVTISDAAREKSKLVQIQSKDNLPVKNELPDRTKMLLCHLPKPKS